MNGASAIDTSTSESELCLHAILAIAFLRCHFPLRKSKDTASWTALEDEDYKKLLDETCGDFSSIADDNLTAEFDGTDNFGRHTELRSLITNCRQLLKTSLQTLAAEERLLPVSLKFEEDNEREDEALTSSSGEKENKQEVAVRGDAELAISRSPAIETIHSAANMSARILAQMLSENWFKLLRPVVADMPPCSPSFFIHILKAAGEPGENVSDQDVYADSQVAVDKCILDVQQAWKRQQAEAEPMQKSEVFEGNHRLIQRGRLKTLRHLQLEKTLELLNKCDQQLIECCLRLSIIALHQQHQQNHRPIQNKDDQEKRQHWRSGGTAASRREQNRQVGLGFESGTGELAGSLRIISEELKALEDIQRGLAAGVSRSGDALNELEDLTAETQQRAAETVAELVTASKTRSSSFAMEAGAAGGLAGAALGLVFGPLGSLVGAGVGTFVGHSAGTALNSLKVNQAEAILAAVRPQRPGPPADPPATPTTAVVSTRPHTLTHPHALTKTYKSRPQIIHRNSLPLLTVSHEDQPEDQEGGEEDGKEGGVRNGARRNGTGKMRSSSMEVSSPVDVSSIQASRAPQRGVGKSILSRVTVASAPPAPAAAESFNVESSGYVTPRGPSKRPSFIFDFTD